MISPTCTVINNSKKSSSVVGGVNVEEAADEVDDIDDTSDSDDEVATELVLE